MQLWTTLGRVVFLALLASSAGCREKGSSSAAPKIIEGDVTADVPGTGRLVVGWRSAAEQREIAAGRMSMKMVVDTMGRWKVGDVTDFQKTPRVHYRIDGAPADATAVIVLDTAHDFFQAIGGQNGKLGTSKPGGGDVRLVTGAPHKDNGEPCAGPRYKLIEVPSPGLPASKPVADGDAGAKESTRRFCAWLPASWAAKPERQYPVVYLLPGYGSNEMTYVHGGGAPKRIDAITEETGREVILVGVDTSTPLGSTYLEDSPVSGAWDTFFTTRAMPAIERALRVSSKRTARATAGHSTGGYNALSFGLRHSDLFSFIVSSSPDAPDMEAWLIEPGTATSTSPGRTPEWIRKWTALEAELGGPGQFTSYAADWADAANPIAPDRVGSDGRTFAIRWPFNLESGAIDRNVLDRWVAKTPHGLLRDPNKVEQLRHDLSGRVYISVGHNDEFGLFGPAERFAKELDAAGVRTTFVPTNDGHAHGLDRIVAGIRLALEHLDRAE